MSVNPEDATPAPIAVPVPMPVTVVSVEAAAGSYVSAKQRRIDAYDAMQAAQAAYNQALADEMSAHDDLLTSAGVVS